MDFISEMADLYKKHNKNPFHDDYLCLIKAQIIREEYFIMKGGGLTSQQAKEQLSQKFNTSFDTIEKYLFRFKVITVQNVQ